MMARTLLSGPFSSFLSRDSVFLALVIAKPCRLVAGNWPAQSCCAPGCRAWSAYPARRYRGRSGR